MSKYDGREYKDWTDVEGDGSELSSNVEYAVKTFVRVPDVISEVFGKVEKLADYIGGDKIDVRWDKVVDEDGNNLSRLINVIVTDSAKTTTTRYSNILSMIIDWMYDQYVKKPGTEEE